MTEPLFISLVGTTRGNRLRFQEERSKLDNTGNLNTKDWKLKNLPEYFFLQFLLKSIAQNYHLAFNLGYRSLTHPNEVYSAFTVLLIAFSLQEHCFLLKSTDFLPWVQFFRNFRNHWRNFTNFCIIKEMFFIPSSFAILNFKMTKGIPNENLDLVIRIIVIKNW